MERLVDILPTSTKKFAPVPVSMRGCRSTLLAGLVEEKAAKLPHLQEVRFEGEWGGHLEALEGDV